MNIKPLFFKTPAEFRKWLSAHHDNETEIWVGFWKKASGKTGMNYDQALDEALCFGWIDGIVNKYDDLSYAQRFTPRRAKSVWSKINTQHIERLTREGKMMPAGIAAVEAAKADGRWAQAYESPANAKIPEDFLIALKHNKKAAEFFKTLNKTNTFYIAYQLQRAKKEETRKRRIEKMIQMLENGKKFL
ncbi:MAG TPA: YdeI/OmpD-associated family protein [Vitreimonas sp.]|nr:YdeI/OmpD-associated family protein [Vitreimonas sp.]